MHRQAAGMGGGCMHPPAQVHSSVAKLSAPTGCRPRRSRAVSADSTGVEKAVRRKPSSRAAGLSSCGVHEKSSNDGLSSLLAAVAAAGGAAAAAVLRGAFSWSSKLP